MTCRGSNLDSKSSDKRGVQVLSALKSRITCMKFKFFLGQLKMQILRQTVVKASCDHGESQ